MYMYLHGLLKWSDYRYEKRQALKARFEIEQKLRRERKAKKTRLKDKKDEKRLQLIREKRSKLQDKRSKAIDELKAKRSAGNVLHIQVTPCIVYGFVVVHCTTNHYKCSYYLCNVSR